LFVLLLLPLPPPPPSSSDLLGCYWHNGDCRGDGERAPDRDICSSYYDDEEEGGVLLGGVGQYMAIGVFGLSSIGFLLWRARSTGGLFGAPGGGDEFQP